MGGVFFTAALTSILAVLLICVFLFANGIPAMGKVGLFKFLAGTNWAPTDSPASFGIFPLILGSIYVHAGVIVIGARLLALRLRIGKQRIPVGLPRRLAGRSRWGILGRPLHQRVNFTAYAQVI